MDAMKHLHKFTQELIATIETSLFLEMRNYL